MNPTVTLRERPATRARDSTSVPPGTRYYDTQLQCTVLATTPTVSPGLWNEFLDGALRSYTRHGVQDALEYDEIVDGVSTSLFFVAIDSEGDLRGGLRVQGPYTRSDQTHADIEWSSDEAGRSALRAMVADRIPDGVVEMKSVWSDPDAPRTGRPGYLGAVGASLAAAALGARFTLATSAEHAVGPYLDSGAVIAAHIDAVPYPDDRYRTRALWWDRATVRSIADPLLRPHITTAVRELLAASRFRMENIAS
jgi:hypothetical protein